MVGRFDLDRQRDPRSIWTFAPETIMRLMEADYFLNQMVENYCEPFVFSFNLHSELQALRNITFQMQKELTRVDGFKVWYGAKQTQMAANPLLKNLNDVRTKVVHRNTLRKASLMHQAVVRDAKLHPMPPDSSEFTDPFMDTANVLREIKQGVCALTQMPPALFETGLKREWIVPELSRREVVGECHIALDYFGRMVTGLAEAFGYEFAWQPPSLQRLRKFQVAFSGPVDPALADCWV